MNALLHKAARLAPQSLPVLIAGRDGCGQGVLARALHAASGRLHRHQLRRHPEALLESELFGYLPGSWTGGASKGDGG